MVNVRLLLERNWNERDLDNGNCVKSGELALSSNSVRGAALPTSFRRGVADVAFEYLEFETVELDPSQKTSLIH